MEFPVAHPQPLIRNVRVDLRRTYVTMTEHHLHRPQIGAILQQHSGKTMPQGVRSYITYLS
jgi:hypothetical protein